MRDHRVERLRPVERDRRGRAVALDADQCTGDARVVEKRAVSHQLGIQPAVIGVVDLFRHQPVEERADLARRRGRVDRNRRTRGSGGRHRQDEQEEHAPSPCHRTLHSGCAPGSDAVSIIPDTGAAIACEA